MSSTFAIASAVSSRPFSLPFRNRSRWTSRSWGSSAASLSFAAFTSSAERRARSAASAAWAERAAFVALTKSAYHVRSSSALSGSGLAARVWACLRPAARVVSTDTGAGMPPWSSAFDSASSSRHQYLIAAAPSAFVVIVMPPSSTDSAAAVASGASGSRASIRPTA